MDQNEILNNLEQSLKSNFKDISIEDMELLLDTTVNVIDSVLEMGDQLKVNDFGVFSRRKGKNASVSFFKPSDRLSDRITKKK